MEHSTERVAGGESMHKNLTGAALALVQVSSRVSGDTLESFVQLPTSLGEDGRRSHSSEGYEQATNSTRAHRRA